MTRLKTNKSSKSIGSSFKEEKNRLDEAQTNKSSKSIDRLFKEEKSRLDQVNLAQQINMNSRNENTAATMTYEIPKRAIPFAFGEKICTIGTWLSDKSFTASHCCNKNV